jgi:hypothetical protein
MQQTKMKMLMGCSNERWKAPNVAWFDMEVAEEGKVFFVNVYLWLSTRLKTQRKNSM